MIPEIHGRQVVSSDEGAASVAFDISQDDTAHLMTILRDTLYSDRVLAVLREYCANARDAHHDPRVAAQRRGTPIRVKLPTMLDPTLEVQDYGPGMAHQEVFQIFGKYGASTKRGSNDAVGYMGIGSKSGFAYGDSFTVVSRHDGRCRTYVAVLDRSERGEIRLLDDAECPQEDSGVTIQLGVRAADVDEFVQKARAVLRYYNPRPVLAGVATYRASGAANGAGDAFFGGPLVTESRMFGRLFRDACVGGAGSSGAGSGGGAAGGGAGGAGDSAPPDYGSGWTAVMGCVPYPVDLGQLDVPTHVHGSAGVVFFDIGALRVSASREGLKYDDHTKASLVAGITDLLDRNLRDFVARAAGLTQWDKRLLLRGMEVFRPALGGLAFPGAFDGWASADDVAKAVAALVAAGTWGAVPPLRLGGVSKGIKVDEATRLVYVDDARSVRGYRLESLRDLVVRRGLQATHAEAWAALQVLCTALRVEGIPVVRASSLPWTKPERAPGGPYRKREAALVFVPAKHEERSKYRRKSDGAGPPPSAMWAGVDRVPEDDDVYVVLGDRYATDLYEHWGTDARLLREFGLAMPVVHGYRGVKGKDGAPPATDANVHPGKTYAAWRAGLYDLVVAGEPAVEALVALQPYYRHVQYTHQREVEKHGATAVARLGAAHPAAALLNRTCAAKAALEGTSEDRRWAVRQLASYMGRRDTAAAEIAALCRLYPLIGHNFPGNFLTSEQEVWLDYVVAMDHYRAHGRKTKDSASTTDIHAPDADDYAVPDADDYAALVGADEE